MTDVIATFGVNSLQHQAEERAEGFNAEGLRCGWRGCAARLSRPAQVREATNKAEAILALIWICARITGPSVVFLTSVGSAAESCMPRIIPSCTPKCMVRRASSPRASS